MVFPKEEVKANISQYKKYGKVKIENGFFLLKKEEFFPSKGAINARKRIYKYIVIE